MFYVPRIPFIEFEVFRSLYKMCNQTIAIYALRVSNILL